MWVTFQGRVTFGGVMVDFSREEWGLLGPAQPTLYHNVMLKALRHLVTVGEAVPHVHFYLPGVLAERV